MSLSGGRKPIGAASTMPGAATVMAATAKTAATESFAALRAFSAIESADIVFVFTNAFSLHTSRTKTGQ